MCGVHEQRGQVSNVTRMKRKEGDLLSIWQIVLRTSLLKIEVKKEGWGKMNEG